MNNQVTIDYFSDTLCVWAYISQIRIDELKQQFGEQIRFNYHFVPVFGCTHNRIAIGWGDRDGFAGFNQHVKSVCSEFPHLELNEEVWLSHPPASSASSHLILKAVQILESENAIEGIKEDTQQNTACENLAWAIRQAFFVDNTDISNLNALIAIAEQQQLPASAIREKIDNGQALAALCRDVELRDQFRIEGSPTFIMNNARQKLYGNVGYRILEANIQELLSNPGDRASWC